MKIAYRKEWNENGTCYKQRITIDKETFLRINDALKKQYKELEEKTRKEHLISSSDMMLLTYCKPLEENENKKYFLNLSQLNYIMWLIPNNRYIYDNTVIYVK